MTISMLPPAGDAIRLDTHTQSTRTALARWQPYQAMLYGSGTAALAAAVAAALALRPQRREIVLPAYGCPALVSAVLHAGGEPVLVDLEPDRPWLSLSALDAAVSDATAAIVAVNFLGIPERLPALKRLSRACGVVLIEDSAQACPPAGLDEQQADLLILSFGRGKPISLLGGGLVLWHDQALGAALPKPVTAKTTAWQLHLKVLLYNLLRRPQLYWLPQVLPLGLGATCYRPLTGGLRGMDPLRQRALGAALEQRRQCVSGAEQRLRAALPRVAPELVDLAAVCGSSSLLRYPLLADTAAVKRQVLGALKRAGLGASAMYGEVLPDVTDMPSVRAHSELVQARDFASRLLTLPVHDGVTPRHIERMLATIEAELSKSSLSPSSSQIERLE